MKKLITTIFAVFSFSVAYAQQNTGAICELTKAKAELSASILSSPYVYGTNNESNTGTLALGYSFSGKTKGNLEKEIANTKCDLLAATALLEEYQQGALISIAKTGARAELVGLLKTKSLIRDKLEQVSRQVEVRTATLTDYNNIRQFSILVDSRIDIIRATLAEPSMSINIQSIPEIINRTKTLEGKLAELSAQREAENSWDLTVAAGAQNDLSEINSNIGPFIGVSFKWSFSNYGMKESVANIKSKAEEAFLANQFGYAAASERLLQKLDALNSIDLDKKDAIAKNIKDIEDTLSNLSTVNTVLANTTRSTLEIQLSMLVAEMNGVLARISRYSSVKN